jgi:hypothetical protein
MTDVDFFFTPPTVDPALHCRAAQSYSVLYLLRREAQDCLLGTVIDEAAVRHYPGDKHRVFATTMVLLSGLDLLGQFRDPTASVEKRFTEFVSSYLYPHEDDAAQALFAVRNALMHTFGLQDATRQLSLVLDQPLARGIQPAAVTTAGNRAVINVLQLFDDVVRAVGRYYRDVRTPGEAHDALRQHFAAMFQKAGTIRLGNG